MQHCARMLVERHASVSVIDASFAIIECIFLFNNIERSTIITTNVIAHREEWLSITHPIIMAAQSHSELEWVTYSLSHVQPNGTVVTSHSKHGCVGCPGKGREGDCEGKSRTQRDSFNKSKLSVITTTATRG